jgi:hypothetical protein
MRVGAQARDAKEYWEGEIVTACDNFMAFLLKLISRYKSINYKNPKKSPPLEKLKYFGKYYSYETNSTAHSSGSGLPDRLGTTCD